MARLADLATDLATPGPPGATEALAREVAAFGEWARDVEAAWSDDERHTVLRALFDLVALDDGHILVPLGLTILALGYSLPVVVLNASKLLFRLSKKEANDTHFAANAASASELVETVARAPLGSSTALFALGTLKNVCAGSKTVLKAVLRAELTSVLADLVSPATVAELIAQAENDGEARAGQTLVQVTALLRTCLNLNAAVELVVGAGVLPSLVALLDRFAKHSELSLNVARVLSKASLLAGAADELARDASGLGKTMLRVLRSQAQRHPLVVRLAFALGNVTTQRPAVCAALGSRRFVSGLLSAIDRYVASHEQLTAADSSSDDDTARAERLALEEVLVKVVRLTANLCVDHAVGERVACASQLERVLDLMERLAVENSEELVLNCVALVTNVSFFAQSEASEGNVVLAGRARVVRLLLPLLLQPNWEMVYHVARAYGNFSRFEDMRVLMAKLRADEAMAVLLDSDIDDVVFAVAGVVTNLQASPASKAALQQHGGVDALIRVVGSKAADADLLDAPSALRVLDVACKALYNFGHKNSQWPFSAAQAAALEASLTALLERVEQRDLAPDTSPAATAAACFAMVGYKLLEMVEAVVHPPAPASPAATPN
ncbi:armadillo repeat-containing protein 2 [Thecamonas trahens ATCC 50062]|uniref:Armadillo repeat-containing protein 2 n=1 Tax=Thecamonas trahens ATCC 50062 TaxID=461836 RepID=A0A0L0D204_THETB|nr:armadillo repeat-containing protein 2 [Thecamonas trahens ATCC 50062]KNC46384.1 armadillo repeat-containing protein 2 [Thecamonas trahens ATCC 50062]|eukprot:XP_013760677.1 armadillo repeat-containing protein 2 [Thecamonas trahens ATCC 50062]